MKTEKEKMLGGERYDALDNQLSDERIRTRLLLKKLNNTPEGPEARNQILIELIPNAGAGLWLQPSFYCDYSSNILTGEKVFFNFNC
jgi:maltose O-acetyltransferase